MTENKAAIYISDIKSIASSLCPEELSARIEEITKKRIAEIESTETAVVISGKAYYYDVTSETLCFPQISIKKSLFRRGRCFATSRPPFAAKGGKGRWDDVGIVPYRFWAIRTVITMSSFKRNKALRT